MKNLKVVNYKDGFTVEDEIGNKLFVQEEVISENNRSYTNALAFALGKMLLDAIYCKRVDMKVEYENEDKNYIPLAH